MFYGLLRCHCGHILTGSRYKNGNDPVYCGYKCHLARTVPNHGPSSIPEKRLLAWIKPQVARVRVPDEGEVEVGREDERNALEARRLRILDMYEAGDLDRDEYQRRMTSLKADEVEFEAMEADIGVMQAAPEIDWEQDSAEVINAALRAMFEPIEMDAAMQPGEPKLRVPHWERPA
jgi:hypothetical protein